MLTNQAYSYLRSVRSKLTSGDSENVLTSFDRKAAHGVATVAYYVHMGLIFNYDEYNKLNKYSSYGI
jgi:hypothetical protein